MALPVLAVVGAKALSGTATAVRVARAASAVRAFVSAQAAPAAGAGVVVGGGAVVQHAVTNNGNTAANNANAKGATQTSVCSTCPPPRCAPLYAKISALTAELASRRAAMLADRPVSQGGLGMYALFLRDPNAVVPDPRGIKPHLGNWRGHRVQILQKQKQLKTLIGQFRAQKCSPLPVGAETQANLPPPSGPFNY